MIARKKIGFFDSGIGGISVLGEALCHAKNTTFLYYADTKHVPYGEKEPAEIKDYVYEAVDFLANKSIDALVVACNTATSVAIKDLRTDYHFPIIGIEPAIKPAVSHLQNNGQRNIVLVTATDVTLRMDKLNKLLKDLDVEDHVERLSLQELVRFAEKGDFSSEEVLLYLQERFKLVDLSEISTLVLGCTHFSFFKPVLKTILPKEIRIIDGNAGTINRLCSFFPDLCSHKRKEADFLTNAIEFYESSETPDTKRKEELMVFLQVACKLALE